MEKKSYKKEKLAEAIKENLSLILLEESNNELFLALTITGVKLSKDLRKAIILYTHLEGNKENILVSLNKAKGFFRTNLAKRLKTKYIPELIFEWDSFMEQMIYEG
ncbi:MAG: ribosome-binding factor [Desulfonauticus sp.]|jgi:ribosome-binding factor A|nr:MAG: Ribosome-binding factor A [Desulfonauticus sp. 38_4375]MDK2920727.1 ribosome-binding factor [Desulfonauticus sp.]